MIHELDDGVFVISSHGQWLPGVYDKRSTAQWAFQFPCTLLDRIQKWCNDHYDGVITRDNLHDEYTPWLWDKGPTERKF